MRPEALERRARPRLHLLADQALFLSALSLEPLRRGAMAALVAGNFDKRLSTLTLGKVKLRSTPLLALADGAAWNKELGSTRSRTPLSGPTCRPPRPARCGASPSPT
ncbi:MAG: hypothetical protein KA387_05505 [Rubrivivax sp.]|nr:hypothetical protein [Rubrivivax sp.]